MRVPIHILRRRELPERSRVHHRHLVAERERFLLVVRHVDCGRAREAVKPRQLLSKLLAEIEQRGARFVICRNGHPVADLVPHQAINRLQPDKKLGAIRIKYDPTEELALNDWPAEAR